MSDVPEQLNSQYDSTSALSNIPDILPLFNNDNIMDFSVKLDPDWSAPAQLSDDGIAASNQLSVEFAFD